MTRRPFAFVTKQGKVVRQEVLERYGVKEGESAQIEDPFLETDFSERGLVAPPYPPESLVNLLDMNTYHMRACRVKARDVAGNGWEIVPKGSNIDSESPEAQARKAVLEEFFDSIEVSKVFSDAQFDHEAVGWGAVEITFGLKGVPSNFYHVQAHTLRVHRKRDKWMQRKGQKRVWFKDIAADRQVDVRTGRQFFLPESDMNTGTTIMSWHNAHPKSSYYGVPDIIPALGAITGDVSRRDYNIAFFENYGVPAYAVFITGDFDPGEPKSLEGDDPDNPTGPTPLEESIEQHFQSLAKEPHSVLVLTVPTSVTDEYGAEGGKVEVEFVPLSTDTKEASFRMYRQDNRDEVLSAHGVDPFRVGLAETGALGGTTVEQATAIYKESVVSPRQEMLENLINRHIVYDMFGITEWQFSFRELDTTNLVEDLQILTGLFTVGAVTPRQIAERFASRFGIDTAAMDHPALNAHYIAGQPVDAEIVDFNTDGDEVMTALNSLQENLTNMALKKDSNGHPTRAEFESLRRSLEELNQ